jgi:hypothetical protein
MQRKIQVEMGVAAAPGGAGLCFAIPMVAVRV